MKTIPINAQKLLGQVTVDKETENVAPSRGEAGYTRYHATSPLQPQGFEIRVAAGKGAKPDRRQPVTLTGAAVAYVRNRSAKGKTVNEYVIYAESLKLN